MKVKSNLVYILLFCIILVGFEAYAQEHTGPLRYNPVVQKASQKHTNLYKTTSGTLSLPFFEDFTSYDPLPDTNKWVEHEVYINNTMGLSPVSRGIATFDGLNANGIPYDTVDNYSFRYCDSLTSQPIDLHTYHPSDSLYLSFFYQPQGNGFYPLLGDSLMLFMRKSYADWKLVWSVPGSFLQPFKQVLIPITDTIFLYNSFQFRFVNIAALNFCDAVWNVDYIRLNSGRNMYDTVLNDVAFTKDPSYLLNDYTSMPYRQFLANPAGERSNRFADSIRNNNTVNAHISYAYTAREITSNTFLSASSGYDSTILSPFQTVQLTTSPVYAATVPSPGNYNKVVFENKFYIKSPSSSDPTVNDTIVKQQVFDNYFAYDDGTAEQSYYLTQFSTLPAYLAIEYHLNKPDTIQGLAIYFGRQTPLPTNKFFSIIIYGSLNGVNGGTYDNILLKEDNITPSYVDTINHFWVYAFNNPLPLPAGLFYAGTMQPAYGGSDSLYFGLDVNRVGSNHAFYNVQGQWNQSQVSGAIMMRPIVGQPVIGTSITNVNKDLHDWSVSPNPANDFLFIDYKSTKNAIAIVNDIQGRTVLNLNIQDHASIDISGLYPGMYFVTLYIDGVATSIKKVIKQ